MYVICMYVCMYPQRPQIVLQEERGTMLEYVVTYVRGDHEVNKLVFVDRKEDVLHESKKAFNLTGTCELEVWNDKHQLFLSVKSLPKEGRLRLVPIPGSKGSPVTESTVSLSPSSTPRGANLSHSIASADTEPVQSQSSLFEIQGEYLVLSAP